jgi:thiol-disulfide isomerase/thioredoxin
MLVDMYRFSVCFLLIFTLATSVRGQERKGINFFQGTWKEMLATARKSHKPVFVDVYTDWCIPCKRMEKEIFVLPEVAEFYNANFICYRTNAEKGEGQGIAKTYGVRAYPAWLYLDSNGVLRSHRIDYMAAAPFIDAGEAALGKDSVSRSLISMEARFRSGERDIAFLRSYIEMRSALQLDNATVLDAYVAARKRAVPDAEELNFLIHNSGRSWSMAIPLIAAQLGISKSGEQQKMANEFFDQTLYFVWANAVKAGDKKIAGQARSASGQIYPLLNEAKQLTFDHAALYHCRMLRTTTGLKKIGYRMAEKQLAVDVNFAHIKDKELLEQVMAPFLNGQQDSTKIPDFAEEKRLAATQYSGKVAGILYEVAEAFEALLPKGDPSLRDAALWAKRAYLLLPNERTKALLTKLSADQK